MPFSTLASTITSNQYSHHQFLVFAFSYKVEFNDIHFKVLDYLLDEKTRQQHRLIITNPFPCYIFSQIFQLPI